MPFGNGLAASPVGGGIDIGSKLGGNPELCFVSYRGEGSGGSINLGTLILVFSNMTHKVVDFKY